MTVKFENYKGKELKVVTTKRLDGPFGWAVFLNGEPLARPSGYTSEDTADKAAEAGIQFLKDHIDQSL